MKNYIYIIALFLIFTSSCRDNSEKSTKNESTGPGTEQKDVTVADSLVSLTRDQYQSLGIKTGSVEKKNLKTVIRANGLLNLPPQNLADVSTFVGGVVKKIFVIEGSKVSKGQTLATLEHPDITKLQEEYIQSRNNLEFLKKEFNRQKELYQENVGAGKVFQQAENNYKTEQSKVNSLKDQLQKISISVKDLDEGKIASFIPIKSPISGYVTHVNVNTGSFVQPATSLFQIVDNSHLHVELKVYEQDWYKVKRGQKVTFIVPSQDAKEVTGEIFAVGKTFDPETKTLSVHAEINNTINLIPGIYVTGYIDTGANDVEALPEEAVIKSGDKDFIFLQQEKGPKDSLYNFKLEEIKTGLNQMGYVEVLSVNMQNHGNIVVNGSYYLWSKMKQGEGGE